MSTTITGGQLDREPVPIRPLPEAHPTVLLPAPLTSLVGREREIAAVCALFRRSDVRLVTLTGPGGIGKTRLALAVSAEVGPELGGDVAFIPLASIREPRLVLPAVAQALGIREGGEGPLAARVAAALRNRNLLLVLDNFEQVLDAAPQIAGLLTDCPALTILVTSRAVLGISGEHAYPVPPLALPSPQPLTLPDLARIESIALFVARAHAADPRFALTAGNASSIASICERLDGLPLAIELAAARITVLSPQALQARLTDRLRILTGGAREQPSRLRSMRDAIAWSHELLSADERVVFRRLAVFAGGCTLEAAEAVCGHDGIDVLEAVSALIGQSLLRRVDSENGSPRFTMLETVREFALDQLQASGEIAELRRHHAHYFAELAARGKLTWWMRPEMANEQPNVRSAIEWAIEHGETDQILWLGIALAQFHEPSSDHQLLERVLTALDEVPADLQGRWVFLLASTAQFAQMNGDLPRASVLIDESWARAKLLQDEPPVALAMMSLGWAALGLAMLDRAGEFALEALRRWRRLAEPGWAAEALLLLGNVNRARSDLGAAEALFTESLAELRAAGPPVAIASVLGLLASCVHERGDQARAASLLAESLVLARDYTERDPPIVGGGFRFLGDVAVAVRRMADATRLYGASEAVRERYGLEPSPTDRVRLERMCAVIRADLTESDFARAWDAGRALSLDQAIADALTIAETIAVQPPPAEEPAVPASDYHLSRRETEVLGLLADGLFDREIAEALFISPKTAGIHVSHLLRKLGVRSRGEAIALAHRRGLVRSAASDAPTTTR